MHGDARLGMQGVLDFDNSSGSGDDDYVPQHGNSMGWDMQGALPQAQFPGQHYGNIGAYGTPPYSAPMQQQDFNFSGFNTIPVSASDPSFREPSSFGTQRDHSVSQSTNTLIGDPYPGSDLSDILGELKIHESGVGE